MDDNETTKKHPGGRPTKYTEEMPELCRKYTREFKKIWPDDVIPTVCGLAAWIGVCEDTLNNWGKIHKEFFGTLGELKNRQQQILFNKGLTGDFNSTIAKLGLMSNHGYKERNDSTSGDKPLQTIINVHLPGKTTDGAAEPEFRPPTN